MARKKRTVFRDAKQQAKPQGDGSDDDYISGGNVKAIDTWEDVEHDDEDEFHEARGKILLSYDNSNNAHDSDDDLLSEEEVFGLDGTAASDEDEDEDDQGALGDDDGDDDADRPDADDLATQSWGRTKKSYYDADQFSDLDEAREEEAEAIRLQKKRVQGMAEEDYLEDVAAWKGGVSLEKDDASDRKLIDTVNQDLEGISFVNDLQTERIAKRSAAELPPAEVLKILQNESPELIELLGEFKNSLRVVTEEVEPVLERAKQLDVTQAPELDFLNLKHQLLLNYLTNISFYLVLKSSNSPHLRDHPVIAALVELRTALEKVERVEKKGGMRARVKKFASLLEEGKGKSKEKVVNGKRPEKGKVVLHGKTKAEKRKKGVVGKAMKRRAVPEDDSEDEAWDDEMEEEENFVTPLEQEFKSLKKVANAAKKRKRDDDFGESEVLELVDAEDKVAKKKSLRDYMSKIDQTVAKRQAKYQGDVDIPYKNRAHRDQKKGVAQPLDGAADLDDADWDESDLRAATDGRTQRRMPDGDLDDPEAFYEAIKSSKAAHKQRKLDEYHASKPGLVTDDADDGDKRGVTWQILKNKGLTPHRKKEQRNARVKHRNKYEKKMKKLGSVKRIVKPLTGAYGGEGTGIKIGLSRSVKLG
ncbi:Sas10 C-terminal domain-containing protein [Jimgerdemannia flammicorona]|uniref:Sas10 C-terminal domain-containing protein n=1 Tax=Jimgerdemannia flammicorona TaxID=994334 RepID=A0A433Q554_9FUNG|nr:Sas10 C-terminal domain-containing protein [Jimgerdemannia flammicorona]